MTKDHKNRQGDSTKLACRLFSDGLILSACEERYLGEITHENGKYSMMRQQRQNCAINIWNRL